MKPATIDAGPLPPFQSFDRHSNPQPSFQPPNRHSGASRNLGVSDRLRPCAAKPQNQSRLPPGADTGGRRLDSGGFAADLDNRQPTTPLQPPPLLDADQSRSCARGGIPRNYRRPPAATQLPSVHIASPHPVLMVRLRYRIGRRRRIPVLPVHKARPLPSGAPIRRPRVNNIPDRPADGNVLYAVRHTEHLPRFRPRRPRQGTGHQRNGGRRRRHRIRIPFHHYGLRVPALRPGQLRRAQTGNRQQDANPNCDPAPAPAGNAANQLTMLNHYPTPSSAPTQLLPLAIAGIWRIHYTKAHLPYR